MGTCVGARYGHRPRLFTGPRLNRISLFRRSSASCHYGFHGVGRFDRAMARLGLPQGVDFEWTVAQEY